MSDRLRDKIHKIQHQLVHPEQYGFPPNPDQATDAIMNLVAAEVDKALLDEWEKAQEAMFRDQDIYKYSRRRIRAIKRGAK